MRVVEGADRERDQRRDGGRGRADPQPPALELGERLELALGRGQAVEDRVGMADEQLAGLGQPHPAGGALDEPCAGLGLERGDLAGDGGLREGEDVGRGGERAVRRDLAQDPETADVKHDQSVYQMSTKIICVYRSAGAACCPCFPPRPSPSPSWKRSPTSARTCPGTGPRACPSRACAPPAPGGRRAPRRLPANGPLPLPAGRSARP